eukprot:2400132-Pleurochrysis_carterae.AAC.1
MQNTLTLPVECTRADGADADCSSHAQTAAKQEHALVVSRLLSARRSACGNRACTSRISRTWKKKAKRPEKKLIARACAIERRTMQKRRTKPAPNANAHAKLASTPQEHARQSRQSAM